MVTGETKPPVLAVLRRVCAERDARLVEAVEGWSPYLSVEDAYKLDDIREALRRGDVKSAGRFARVFTLTPI